MAKKEHWLAEPEVADFDAAAQYLTLVLADNRSRAVATRLGDAPILRHRANDLLRASGLPLLPADDPEVVKDLRKIRKGKKLSPVLLVRGGLGERTPDRCGRIPPHLRQLPSRRGRHEFHVGW